MLAIFNPLELCRDNPLNARSGAYDPDSRRTLSHGRSDRE